MDLGFLIILATIGSLLSLIGGFLLISNKTLAQKIAVYSAPFAAGALIAAALVDVLPEAVEEATDPHIVGVWIMLGMAIFFLLERQLGWFHHHHEHKSEKHDHQRLPAMLVVGDTIHNAIDGAVIAIAFLADPALGVVTTFAVALHEIPQEIGDFGLLLKAGWSRRRVMLVNALSAVSTILAAVLVYLIGESIEPALPYALALTAGILLYIASSDIIPSVHNIKSNGVFKDTTSYLFFAGLVIVTIGVLVSHSFIE